MWWTFPAFIWTKVSFKDCFLCIDVWITCTNRDHTLDVAVTGDLCTLQDRAGCNLQAPLAFPCSWGLFVPFTSASLGSPCTSWDTYLLNTFHLLFCLDVCRWEEWMVLHRVPRDTGLPRRGSTRCRSLHRFDRFSVSKDDQKVAWFVCFQGKKPHI